jgi:hypothetical protein
MDTVYDSLKKDFDPGRYDSSLISLIGPASLMHILICTSVRACCKTFQKEKYYLLLWH